MKVIHVDFDTKVGKEQNLEAIDKIDKQNVDYGKQHEASDIENQRNTQISTWKRYGQQDNEARTLNRVESNKT